MPSPRLINVQLHDARAVAINCTVVSRWPVALGCRRCDGDRDGAGWGCGRKGCAVCVSRWLRCWRQLLLLGRHGCRGSSFSGRSCMQWVRDGPAAATTGATGCSARLGDAAAAAASRSKHRVFTRKGRRGVWRTSGAAPPAAPTTGLVVARGLRGHRRSISAATAAAVATEPCIIKGTPNADIHTPAVALPVALAHIRALTHHVRRALAPASRRTTARRRRSARTCKAGRTRFTEGYVPTDTGMVV
jgi:hypothetical protein